MFNVGHLMLNKLALYLVAHNSAHDTGEWLVNRMNIVDMHVQSLLACERFTANVARDSCLSPRPSCTSPCSR